MKDKTLLVLAAGMGSRFGGLKQIEPVGPNGEFIIDYSIYDAIRSGFNKVVFIIKKENYEIFKETIGARVEGHVKVEYVFQDMSNVPKKYEIPSSRVKPLGTAHAILCCKNVVDEQFAIINADDFYGFEGYKDLSEFMSNNINDIGIVGYDIIGNLSPNGSVKRGVIVNNNDIIENIIESKIEMIDSKIIAEPLNGDDKFEIEPTTSVSMNLMAFPKNFMNYIEEGFIDFLENSDLEKDEYLIPDVVKRYIKDGKNAKLVKTKSTWMGITYKEDKEELVNYIANKVKEGVYKNSLWD